MGGRGEPGQPSHWRRTRRAHHHRPSRELKKKKPPGGSRISAQPSCRSQRYHLRHPLHPPPLILHIVHSPSQLASPSLPPQPPHSLKGRVVRVLREGGRQACSGVYFITSPAHSSPGITGDGMHDPGPCLGMTADWMLAATQRPAGSNQTQTQEQRLREYV